MQTALSLPEPSPPSPSRYQTLGCTRTVLDIVRSHLPDISKVKLQSDGASSSNLNCTAFMVALPRVGQSAGLQVLSHTITEVGAGKTKQDTDFQQVSLSLNQVRTLRVDGQGLRGGGAKGRGGRED